MSSSEAASFSELFDQSFTELWGYVRRRVSSAADADDVTSEVFAVAWRRRHGLPPAHEQRLWLFGVARNVVRNHKRSIFRQQRLAIKLAGVPEASHDASFSPPDDALWSALARLSDDDRDILMMRAWDQLAVGAIAEILDCTPNAASLRLHRARTHLRRQLDGKDLSATGDEELNPAMKGEFDDRT